MLFSLLSGALVDRLDRRRLMAAVDLFRTVVVGVLGMAVMLGWASLPLMYVAIFLLGTAETLFANASIAIMPAVVPKERLERANGRLFAAELSANEFAGPPIGGALFAAAAALPFLVDAGTFAASAALLLALRGRFRVAAAEGPAGTTIAAEIAEGLAWLLRHRLLLVLAIMLGAGNLTFSATFSVLVLLAQDVLGLGSVGYGVLLTAGGSAGFWVPCWPSVSERGWARDGRSSWCSSCRVRRSPS